ncbi:M28 family peptidase [Phaeocystidibacter luteus]|uniref:M28 family peptidase n=1 Tax=Phaeocystidibacter luteus TaxID=911197 RepID=A0A6N6RJS7_9FLAO|nr:M28 family peptidase [Phaeocystidibacter luteus]KAB2813940.1 M28 family peptidase [Phaeocystidibacter luteus]
MKQLLLTLLFGSSIFVYGQSNMQLKVPNGLNVLQGNYDPSAYASTNPITAPSTILNGIQSNVEADSLKALLVELEAFGNRNTGADTVSTTTGIGAARRWILSKFEEYSAARENRLLTGYFQFDQNVCGMGQHKNVVAILPGSDTSNSAFILIEGHFDSRCEGSCDVNCDAPGMEDNGSGTALVMELARVMSEYTFPQTIVFMPTTGEEQGLIGATAFAGFALQNQLQIEAVLNNDVIGGIICGQTASPPGCPFPDHIDSTQVRLYSFGGFNSTSKMLSRFIKMEYMDEVYPNAAVPMNLSIMSAEDRTGRGGDHIPFRVRRFPAMRFTSANEHGDAGVSDSAYHDRQHTTADVLGVDTDGDMELDSFYVDFNYLRRNAIINGNAAAVLALGPEQPSFTATSQPNGIQIQVTDPNNYGTYRLIVRSTSPDYDTTVTFSGTNATVDPGVGGSLFVSLAAVDANGLESLPDEELSLMSVGIEEESNTGPSMPELLQNRPNPFDDATIIGFNAPLNYNGRSAIIRISDANGKVLAEIPKAIEDGINEVLYQHGFGVEGIFYYTLLVEGEVIDTKKMVFAY